MMRWIVRPPEPIRRSFFAMGTEIAVTVAPRHRRDRVRAEDSIAEVCSLLRDFGREWWAWGPGAVSQINQTLIDGGVATIPPEMRPLFVRAWQMQQRSGGLYDPRVARLVRLWGFDDMARLRSSPPPAGEIDALRDGLLQAPGYDGGEHYGPAAAVGWDFGGIAKGYVVDVALELLRRRGFDDATIDAGGNLAVRGRRGDRFWRVGIRSPRIPDDATQIPLLATLDACNEAVNTHGDDQRGFDWQGRRYAHLLDPRSGWPAQGLRSLTVVHPDGVLAEAGGAALFVAGPAAWPALARQLQLHQIMAVDDEGRITATAALARRLQAEPGVEIREIRLAD